MSTLYLILGAHNTSHIRIGAPTLIVFYIESALVYKNEHIVQLPLY